MESNGQIKELIRTHRTRIEVFQWAFIAGAASLFYSEFIRNMRQKSVPVRHIDIPSIRYVQRMLSTDGKVLQYLSDHFIDDLLVDDLLRKYLKAPELELFLDQNLDSWKTIFDLYVLPNLSRYLPETIAKKFRLDDEKQQLFRESSEIELFDGAPIASDRYNFLIHETILQLLLLLPTVQRAEYTPETNEKIWMTKSSILTIGNPNAICPIHLDYDTLDMGDSMKLIEYVTNTDIQYISDRETVTQEHDERVEYIVKTSPFNQTSITRLGEIVPLKEEETEGT